MKRNLLAILALATLAAISGCDGEQFGTAGVPQIRLSHDAITFQSSNVGQRVLEDVTIFSDGTKPLVVTSITIEPAQDDFGIRSELELPLTLEPGLERTLTLYYEPQTLGDDVSAELVVVCNDSNAGVSGRLTIPISVQSQSPQLARSKGYLGWDYDDPRDTNLGCAEEINRRELQLTNRGSGQLFMQGYGLEGDGLPEGETAADHFSVCPPGNWRTMAIGSGGGSARQQTWWIVFHPTTDGVKRAVLTLESNGGNATVRLEGGGEGSSSIEVTPPALSWPELAQGEEGVKSLDIVNTGSLSVRVESIRILPGPQAQFYSLSGATFVPNEGQTSGKLSQPIPKGGAARLEVRYSASQPEPVQARLEIEHSAATPASRVVIPLMGNTGTPQMQLEPIQLEFTGTPLGTSAERTVVVRNVGNALLQVDRVEIGPDGETEGWENFSCHPEPCAAELGPDESETFTLRYHRPIDAIQVQDQGCANVYSNDPSQTPSVCLGLLARNPEGNTPPAACIEATPQTTVDVDTEVTLSCACSSDVDEGQAIERCEWVLVDRPASSSAALSRASGDPDNPVTLTPDTAGTYRVTLVVVDDSATHFRSPEEDIVIVGQQ